MNKHSQPAGALRLRQIIKPTGPIPISASSWWSGVKKGIYPQPIKLGPRITAWRLSDIEALLQQGISAGKEPTDNTGHRANSRVLTTTSNDHNAIPSSNEASAHGGEV
ncbi:helix-turn-helix transcriptional regulator [Methylobacterium sp. E-045]|uniref:helix-turn-helix transcriptional regulator n=1 Tax=Methylobacterium sp. E-045 TaxID=2836575 RepID=UPI001FB8C36C|nr:AlpA family phage regulatory protein [Methylobacterium sp. E-045]MCJ2127571.1 AlpA family phage regulatory protein [Methylobacterium sp. E-045]